MSCIWPYFRIWIFSVLGSCSIFWHECFAPAAKPICACPVAGY